MDTVFLFAGALGKGLMQFLFMLLLVFICRLPQILHEAALYLAYWEENKK